MLSAGSSSFWSVRLLGLLLLGGVLGLSAHSDLQNAEKQFEDTISYVKEQCTELR